MCHDRSLKAWNRHRCVEYPVLRGNVPVGDADAGIFPELEKVCESRCVEFTVRDIRQNQGNIGYVQRHARAVASAGAKGEDCPTLKWCIHSWDAKGLHPVLRICHRVAVNLGSWEKNWAKHLGFLRWDLHLHTCMSVGGTL